MFEINVIFVWDFGDLLCVKRLKKWKVLKNTFYCSNWCTLLHTCTTGWYAAI